MSLGWVKVHRKLLHSDIFDNEKMLKVFIYCLLKTSHKSHKVRVGRQVVELEPGQFVFGRKQAAAELKMSESTVWRYMKSLETETVLLLKPNNKFTLVTLANWAVYQGDDVESGQQKNNRWTTDEQQMDTNKNVKNVKNEKKLVGSSKDVFNFYQTNFGTLSSHAAETVLSYIDDTSEAVVLKAMQMACESGKPYWNYSTGILKKWIKANVKTLEDAERYESKEGERYEQDNRRSNEFAERKDRIQPIGRYIPKSKRA